MMKNGVKIKGDDNVDAGEIALAGKAVEGFKAFAAGMGGRFDRGEPASIEIYGFPSYDKNKPENREIKIKTTFWFPVSGLKQYMAELFQQGEGTH
jgi:hypothetical protein